MSIDPLQMKKLKNELLNIDKNMGKVNMELEKKKQKLYGLKEDRYENFK